MQAGLGMGAATLHSPMKVAHRHRHRRRHWHCPSIMCSTDTFKAGESKTENTRVLILGATGHVGGSTAKALAKFCPSLQLVLAGRNRVKGSRLAAELGPKAEFAQVDIDNVKTLAVALSDVDLVVHTAGPFQREEKCAVLEAAISNKTAYIDVCDDRRYSCLAKTFHEKAVAAQVPAITTAGIYPGVSNLMAAELVRLARTDSSKETASEPERLRFYYFTAGSGGAGPTILATSFLLLGEEVIAYRKGKEIRVKPYSGMLDVDFGMGVGKKAVYLLLKLTIKSFMMSVWILLIAKALVRRLSPFMDKFVNESQSAFMKERRIVDSITLATEALYTSGVTKKGLILLKVDVAKAYDSLEWDYLLAML